MKKEIDQISQQTTFNGMNLLDGTIGGGSLTVKTTNSNDVSVSEPSRYNNTDIVVGKNLGGYSPLTSDFRINSIGSITASKPGSYTFAVGVVDEDGKFIDTGVTGMTTHVESRFVEEDTGNEVRTVISIADILKADESGLNITLNLSTIGLGKIKMTMDHFDSKRCFENAMKDATLTTTYQNVATTGGVALNTANVKEMALTGSNYAKFTMSESNGAITFKNLANNKEMAITFGTTLSTPGKTIEIDLGDIGLGKLAVTADSTKAILTADFAALGTDGILLEGEAKGDGTVVVQAGAGKGDTMDISIAALTSQGLGLTNLSIATRGEGTGTAGAAIEGIKNAITKVSEQRSQMGAAQNRLNYKVNNLKVSSENLSAAESRIRDVDIAKEMTIFTNSGILSQAATSMLAQANTTPQQVLTLIG